MTENAPGGIGGSFAGNVWTSNPIPSGTAYDFDFDDVNGCGPANASGLKNCNCATFAGTMNTTPIPVCDPLTATATHNGGQNLDANDVLSYILHSTSGGTVGTVYASGTTPTFSFSSPPLTYGVTYYISAVAGNNDGTGKANLTDPCLSVAAGTPVVWNAAPTATPANNGPLCAGATLNLTSNTVTGGTHAWSGPNNFAVQNPTIASAAVSDGGTYTLIISANGCSSAPVTTTVVVNAPTTPTFTAINPVCLGAPAPTLPTTSNEGISGSWSPGVSTATAGTTTHTFTPTAGQCATTATTTITVNPLPFVDAGSPQSVCQGTAVTLAGSGASTYTWSNSVNDDLPFTPGVGTVTYTVTGTDGNTCQNTDQVTVTVFANPTVTATASQTSACLGTAITLTGGGAIIYGWDNGVTNGVPFTPGSGTVTYNVTGTDGNGCAGTNSATVTIFDLPVVDAGPDQFACPAEEVTLSASGAVTYSWAGATNNVPFIPSATQTYTVTGTDGNGCQGTDQAIVTLATPPVANFSVNQLETTVSEPIFNFSNESVGAATYVWEFGDTETSTDTDPTHMYEATPATYTVWLYATSAEGCVDSTRQMILVKDELIFWIPNTFTPNGDEVNNTFLPVFTSGFDPYSFSMYIYNRWGELIFESHNAEIGWDGTYRGQQVPEGLYIWNIKVKDPQTDKKFAFTGHINVMK